MTSLSFSSSSDCNKLMGERHNRALQSELEEKEREVMKLKA
jgi:hypothetical protein